MNFQDVFSVASEVYMKLSEIEKRLYQVRRDFLDTLNENDVKNVLLSLSEDHMEVVSRLSSLERQVYDAKEEVMDLSIFLRDISKSKNKKKE